MKEYIIRQNESGQRLDKYLKKLLSNAPGSFIYKMLRKKNIVLNGKRADGSEKINLGDSVKLFLSDDTIAKFNGQDERMNNISLYERLYAALQSNPSLLPIIYEDDDIIIFNKPAGMLSQKADAADISANEYLIAYLIESGAVTTEDLATFSPSVCNRLDRNTSGLLTAGKTLKGLQEMSSALKSRSVQKYYRCIVSGEIKKPREISGYLTKDTENNTVSVSSVKTDGSVRIETAYSPVRYVNGCTELEVHLITGKTHQIRAHLAAEGHPIVGDPKYGDAKINAIFRRKYGITHQMLHAYRLEFDDGRTVTAPCGEEFLRILG